MISFSGRDPAELTPGRLASGELGPDDVRIHPETLRHQAEVAERHGNPQLAANFRRAAELATVPEDEVMALYEALRPHRSDASALEALAVRLEEHRAPACAALVREGRRGLRPPRSTRVSAVAAGIDIGNSTTEVVLAALGPAGPQLVGAGQAPTRRAKGSPESLDGAAALVRRLEREHGVRVSSAAAALLRPVRTRTAMLPVPSPDTGRLAVAGAAARTAGRPGIGAGPPHRLGDPAPQAPGPVVAVAPAGLGYRETVDELAALSRAGVRVAAVALADDEAVLVSHRWPGEGPVVDEVQAEELLGAEMVAIEVAEAGRPLREVADPLRLAGLLVLDAAEYPAAARLALLLADRSNAVVVRGRSTTRPPARTAGAGTGDGQWLTFPGVHHEIHNGPVGLVRTLDPGTGPIDVDDAWSVDLAAVATAVLAREGAARAGSAGLAWLSSDPDIDPSAGLADRLGITVRAGSEARAARAGALSTPGLDGLDGVVVLDIGGGTVDAVAAGGPVVAAGAGELLTACVAALTGTTSAAAEWVKRGPAVHVQAPQILLGEDGGRRFVDRPAPAPALGALAVDGPAGLLPFARELSIGEWRALRLRLKVEVLGANVARALRTLDVPCRAVVLVGGPVGDDEVLSVVARSLPDGVAVARGDVAGKVGHRYAVAYGLLREPTPRRRV